MEMKHEIIEHNGKKYKVVEIIKEKFQSVSP